MMFLFTILSTFICLQLITVASSAPSEQLDSIRQSDPYVAEEDLSNSESDEEHANYRRSNLFLKLARQIPSASGSFLRFGREIPSASGSFLRFGRKIPSASGSFLRFGRKIPSASGSFLRFGRADHHGATLLRRALAASPSNFHRFARKGEFLRFG